MPKKNHSKLLILSSVVIIVLVIFLIPSSILQSNQFQLPIPASLNPTGTDGVAITCKVKQTTEVYTSTKRIAEIQSTGIEGSPSFLSLTSQNNEALIGFTVTPKIFCTNLGDVKYPLTVDSARLQLRVYSENPDGTKKITEVKNISTDNINFQSGDGEKDLGYFGIYADDLERKLAGTDFSSLQEFRVSGNLVVYFTQFGSIKYTIPIEETDIRTYYQAKIITPQSEISPETRDTDGDRILDINDDCPTQKENFNGYQDTDGCPDVKPDEPITIEESSTPEPTSKEKCEADGNVWIVYEAGVSICRAGSDDDGTPVPFSTNVVINLDVTYSDGKKQQMLFEDPTFTIDFASLTGSIVGGDVRTISSMKFTPFLKFAVDGKLYSYETGNVKLVPTVRVAGTDIKLNPVQLTGASKTAGQVQFGKFTGFQLGQGTISSVEIHNAIDLNLVPVGQSRDVKLNVKLEGTTTVKRGSGTLTATIDNVSIDWNALKITREVEPKVGGGATGNLRCEENGKVQVTIGGVNTCADKGASSENPNPKVGDTGVNICTDPKAIGGFACTKEYRDKNCSGTTTCKLPVPVTKTSDTSCPDDGLQSANLADNCLTVPVDDKENPKGVTCNGCGDSSSNSTSTFIIVGAVLAFVGIILIALKRKGG